MRRLCALVAVVAGWLVARVCSEGQHLDTQRWSTDAMRAVRARRGARGGAGAVVVGRRVDEPAKSTSGGASFSSRAMLAANASITSLANIARTHNTTLDLCNAVLLTTTVHLARLLKDNLLAYALSMERVAALRLLGVLPLYVLLMRGYFTGSVLLAEKHYSALRVFAVCSVLVSALVCPNIKGIVALLATGNGKPLRRLAASAALSLVYVVYDIWDLLTTSAVMRTHPSATDLTLTLSPLLCGGIAMRQASAPSYEAAVSHISGWVSALSGVLVLSRLPTRPATGAIGTLGAGRRPAARTKASPRQGGIVVVEVAPTPPPAAPVLQVAPKAAPKVNTTARVAAAPASTAAPLVQRRNTTTAAQPRISRRAQADTVPLALGVETADGAFTRLIDKGSAVPVSRTLLFSTSVAGQEEATIKVYEGDQSVARRNVLQGSFVLKGLRPASGSNNRSQIEIDFGINRAGVLTVRACEFNAQVPQMLKRAVSHQFAVKKISVLSKKQIDALVKGAVPKPTANGTSFAMGRRRIVRATDATAVAILNSTSLLVASSVNTTLSVLALVGARLNDSVGRSSRNAGTVVQRAGAALKGARLKVDGALLEANAYRRKLISVAKVVNAYHDVESFVSQLSAADKTGIVIGVAFALLVDSSDVLWRTAAMQVYSDPKGHLVLLGKYNLLLGLCTSALVLVRNLARYRRRATASAASGKSTYRSLFSPHVGVIALLSLPLMSSLWTASSSSQLSKHHILAMYFGLVFQYVSTALSKLYIAPARTRLLASTNSGPMRKYFDTFGSSEGLGLVALAIGLVSQQVVLAFLGTFAGGARILIVAFYALIGLLGYLTFVARSY